MSGEYLQLIGVNFKPNPHWPLFKREETVIAEQKTSGPFADEPLEPSDFEREEFDQIVTRTSGTGSDDPTR